MAQKQKTSETGSRLRDRIEEVNRDVPLSKLAADAQVSTKALVLIKDPEKWKKKLHEARKSNSRRWLAGLAASVTRLAVHLDLKPTQVLEELGFPLDDPGVRTAAARATVHAKRRQLVSDTTLATIKGRAAETVQVNGIVKVAVLNWQPFYDEDYERSFAKRYIHMLLGALDPTWEIDDTPVNSIRDAINGVLQEPSGYDLVFGLYSVPFRQSIGLAFIPVPGLRVPLGVVTKESSTLDWEAILQQEHYEDFQAVVLDEEAGFHMLAGACGYPRGSLEILAEHDTEFIAEALVKQVDRATKSGKEALLVADRFTCLAVSQQISSWRQGAESPRGLQQINIPSLKVLKTSDWTPSYAVALGLRADSPFFGRLLTEAACVDVFHNAALRAASLYFDLLRKPASEELIVEPNGFNSLGDEHCRRFFKAYAHVYREKLGRLGLAEQDLQNTPAKQLFTEAVRREDAEIKRPESTGGSAS